MAEEIKTETPSPAAEVKTETQAAKNEVPETKITPSKERFKTSDDGSAFKAELAEKNRIAKLLNPNVGN